MAGQGSGKGQPRRSNSRSEKDLSIEDREPDSGLDRDGDWLEEIRRRLIAWYEESHRDLPWRIDRDPYRILVSEMMLVQTTVTAVVPYYERFLHQFPDVQALARADETDVLKAWEGLGYYRRAKQLHAAAKAIVDVHGGMIPSDPDRIRSLPGVGRYIAGAILSFAFDRPEPILEANTQRVLARLLAWRGEIRSTLTQARLWRAAERLVPMKESGTFNQALMELGAMVCTPRPPGCLVCPVASFCRAYRLGLQDALPLAVPKPPPLLATEACAVVRREGEVLVVQRGAGGLWEGFWEFPTINLEGADPASRSFTEPVDLAEGLYRLTGIRVRPGPRIKTLSYSVTKHKVRLHVHLAVAVSGTLKPGPGLAAARWVSPESLGDYPFGSAGRRIASWIAQNPGRLGDG